MDYFFYIKFRTGKVMAKRGLSQSAAEKMYKFYRDNAGGYDSVGYQIDNDVLSNRVLLKNAEMI